MAQSIIVKCFSFRKYLTLIYPILLQVNNQVLILLFCMLSAWHFTSNSNRHNNSNSNLLLISIQVSRYVIVTTHFTIFVLIAISGKQMNEQKYLDDFAVTMTSTSLTNAWKWWILLETMAQSLVNISILNDARAEAWTTYQTSIWIDLHR